MAMVCDLDDTSEVQSIGEAAVVDDAVRPIGIQREAMYKYVKKLKFKFTVLYVSTVRFAIIM